MHLTLILIMVNQTIMSRIARALNICAGFHLRYEELGYVSLQKQRAFLKRQNKLVLPDIYISEFSIINRSMWFCNVTETLVMRLHGSHIIFRFSSRISNHINTYLYFFAKFKNFFIEAHENQLNILAVLLIVSGEKYINSILCPYSKFYSHH